VQHNREVGMSVLARIGLSCCLIAMLAAHGRVNGATPVITMSVGPIEALTFPSNMASLPDEHTTIFPPAAGSTAYRFFAASSLTGGYSGTVVLETSDLKAFVPATGYAAQVMTAPVHLRQCDPAYNSEFDENYASQGSVVQDPTLPPGNLIMIYEAENHCPGGVPQYPFYATVGFARSSDNGKTWPAPANAEFGNADRYPVLKVAASEATVPADAAIGDAIPSAIVDGNYLYVPYIALPGPTGVADGKIHIARGLLGGTGPVTFLKWNNGSFSSPGIGGAETTMVPAGGCVGGQGMPSIYKIDSLNVFVLTFVCRNEQTAQAGWYFSTASSLDLQDWSVPQLIQNSQSVLAVPCPGQASTDGEQFDGWFQSLMSPGAASGHIAQAGYAFIGTGCDTGTRSFARRTFAINVGASPPNLDQHGLTGSWFQAATSGQGLEIEVFPGHVAQGTGFLQGSWFTFDNVAGGGADHGRWYTFSGNVLAGDAAAVFTMYQNVGGNFDAPPATQSAAVGHASISFADCTSGQLNYTFTDGSGRVGTMPFTRLTPNVECTPSGSATASGDFGLSGNWYDSTKSGQGFVVELNPVANALFFAWYTYAVNGQSLGVAGQRWYTGQASYTPGARSVPLSLYETTGGLFNTSPPVPSTVAVGTGRLTFTSCSAATLSFTITAGSNAGQAGNVPLTRVGPTPASCAF
jgi:hypothetical protein